MDLPKQFYNWLESKESDLPEFSENALTNLILEYSQAQTDTYLSSIKASMPKIIEENKLSNSSFLNNHLIHWAEPLNLLELLVSECINIGSKYSLERKPDKEPSYATHIGLLVRLHGKACAIANEILFLLKNGFPDAAQARWRSLHEINVTLYFIAKHGIPCSERFLAHGIIDSYELMKSHKNYEHRLQEKGPSQKESEEIQNLYNETIKKYGADFKKQYGWATPFIDRNGSGNIGFQSIEKNVNLEHMRPYFKWACQNIHINIKTITNSLSSPVFNADIINIGPSNFGLTDPAHAMALSIMQATCCLINTNPTLENIITANALRKLAEEIGDSFLSVSNKLEK
ncbi:DUF5677 domain-containing protein [Salmonella enterica subsp. enterica serovar Chester]|uniref:DUF5677 domain-containing protein n=1 Tax=Salmonella enterica TaxID=28901 RepID=UPI0009A9D2BD|nr:DUF5677 domain-containing protein [Salmonella enterica]EBS3910593.1 hypothetical protein [Salmonella enterica subsp. enterica serovar Tilene]